MRDKNTAAGRSPAVAGSSSENEKRDRGSTFEQQARICSPDGIINVSPFRCRMWEFHDRLEEYLTEESCRSEIQSAAEHGQVVPVLGRRVLDDSRYDVELVYGARRLFIARYLNRTVQVRLRDLSDQQALIAMDIENRQRKDISPYERGLSYARWLRAGLFKSQEDIARNLHVSPATVSRLLRIARLPSVILNAFPTPLDLLEEWALHLADIWDDSSRRGALLRRARALAASHPRPPARAAYAYLVSEMARSPGSRATPLEEVVRGEDGRALFRIRKQRRAIALLLPADSVTHEAYDALKREVSALLERTKGAKKSRATSHARDA